MLWRTSDGRFGGASAAGTTLSDIPDEFSSTGMRPEALCHHMLQRGQSQELI